MPSGASSGFLALRDRAYAFLRAHGPASESELLAHVFGAAAPNALLLKMAEPLRGDPRLARSDDGTWSVIQTAQRASIDVAADATHDVTALVVAATGPSPRRGRIVRVVAVRIRDGQRIERFAATVHPEARVPDYVARRLGLEREVLNEQPSFASVLDAFVEFLGDRPVVAQDAQIAWDFVDAEARRVDRVIPRPALIDANDLATRVLRLETKPTLSAVAASLGISVGRIAQADEEARVLALVVPRLLAASSGGMSTVNEDAAHLLRSTNSLASLPNAPGVYVLRDRDDQAVYVGKARRLRERVGSYVHRPLGATRRLEGLVGSVAALEPVECDTDLEALVLEDREIRRLQPRFNVVRAVRRPRLWIRLPPAPVELTTRGRARAPRRLESSEGPTVADGAFVGPFVTETAADEARRLARDVFDLDASRIAGDAMAYEAALEQAWSFLHGEGAVAEERARATSFALLRRVLACDIAAQILPADPFHARYAVVRPRVRGAEAFLLDCGICTGWSVVDNERDLTEVVRRLLSEREERSGPDDVAVAVRWLGAQRTRGTLLKLPADPLAAMDALEDALASALRAGVGEA
jgi:DNA polymerase-3 subunit epsilon